jgi:hypothetical protein
VHSQYACNLTSARVAVTHSYVPVACCLCPQCMAEVRRLEDVRYQQMVDLVMSKGRELSAMCTDSHVAQPPGLNEALAAIDSNDRNPGAAAELLSKLLHMLAEVQVGLVCLLGPQRWCALLCGCGQCCAVGSYSILRSAPLGLQPSSLPVMLLSYMNSYPYRVCYRLCLHGCCDAAGVDGQACQHHCCHQ